MSRNTLLLWLLFLLVNPLQAQFTITGLRGLVVVPEANIIEDRQFLIGLQTNPAQYRLITYPDTDPAAETIYSINLGFIPRVNLILNLTRVKGLDTLGIGDRSGQISILIIRNHRFLPNLVVNLDNSFFPTNNYIAGNHFQLSKTFHFSKMEFHPTMGYGIPVVWSRTNPYIREKESRYLNGFFGGVRLTYSAISIMLEYDSEKVNAGINRTLWDHLAIKLYTMGFQTLGFGINWNGLIR